MMENPYAVLGITEGTEERDIKRAYSKLIKQFRPESHPEEFRRIHDAYQLLRDHPTFIPATIPMPATEQPSAALSDLDGAPTDRPEDSPAAATTATPTQQKFDAAIKEIRTAIAQRNKEKAISLICNQLRGTLPPELFSVIKTVPGTWAVQLARKIHTRDLIAEVKQGRTDYTFFFIKQWVNGQHYDRLVELGQSWLNEQADLYTPPGGYTAERLAWALSIKSNDLAKSLANAFFDMNLFIDQQEQADLDHLLMLGHALATGSSRTRTFWSDILVRERQINWGSPDAQQELEKLQTHPEGQTIIQAVQLRLARKAAKEDPQFEEKQRAAQETAIDEAKKNVRDKRITKVGVITVSIITVVIIVYVFVFR